MWRWHPCADIGEVRGTLGGLALPRRDGDLAVGGHLRAVVEDGRRADDESEVLLRTRRPRSR
jgi:hypothetical protein